MRPVLLTVNDDPIVLRAIERDLRQQYGSRLHILKSNSGQKPLELVKSEPASLLVLLEGFYLNEIEVSFKPL